MEWLQSINRAIRFMEENLCEEISVEDVAAHVYSSYSNFARIFDLVTGVTLSEYIRNRRLSQAGRELLESDAKIMDIALKYQYDTPESFSKAFSRFHGIAPSEVRRNGGVLEYFYPFTVNISLQGGYSVAKKLIDEFYWHGNHAPADNALTEQERYDALISWARKARGKNPNVFDRLVEWLQDEREWSAEHLEQNRQILMQGVLARFKEQNAQLRLRLLELRPTGLVNEAVFKALDRFDEELSGVCTEPELKAVVADMFHDFSVMADAGVRRMIAGDKSGPAGVNTVRFYGYINCLKDCDAQVQWSLFMPDTVRRQQDGFKVERFEYIRASAMRFIGKEGPELADLSKRQALFNVLDGMSEYASDIPEDILFMHHHGQCVDVAPWHMLWGRFMQADAPIPEGFEAIDFVTEYDGGTGAPYVPQYAYAVFSGDAQAMHREEGYDVHGMYDVTRNIILGQGVMIPYPHKYWTAEVFPEGCGRPGTAFLFSVDLAGG